MSSAVTFIAATVVLALTGGFFAVGLLLQDEPAPPAALASASPAPSPEPSAAPAPTATPSVPATTAKRPFTRTLVEFPDGTDPTELVRSEDGWTYYLDRSAATVWMVDLDGFMTEAVRQGDTNEPGDTMDGARPTVPALGEPRRLATGDTFLLTIDADGGLWAWDQRTPEELLRHLLRDAEGNYVGELAIDPDTPAIAAYTRGYEDYDLFVIPPDVGSVVRYTMQAKTSDFLPPKGMLASPYEGVTRARDLYADPDLYLLLPQGVLRLGSGRRDEFALEAPSGETDYHFIDGTGKKKNGRLYVYDAAGSRIIEYAKSDGRLISEWGTGPGQPAMADVRGMVAVAGAKGEPSTVMLMTPDGIYESVLSTDPADAPEPDAIASDSQGAADEVADASTDISEMTGTIRVLIRRLDDLQGKPDRTTEEQAETEALVGDIAALQQDIERLAADMESVSGSKAIDWRTPSTTLEADRLRITTNDLVFKGVESPFIDFTARDDYRELWTEWPEHDRKMRLVIQMKADDTHWWVSEIQTYDGTKMQGGGWIEYQRLAPLTRTPRGETLELDLRLSPSQANRKELKKDARLRIDGMRLTAFAPGTNTAPLEVTGCQPVPEDAGVLVEVNGREAIDYFAEGTLLEGIHLSPPSEASERLTELGICHEYKYYYDFLDRKQDRGIGTSERWCTMPDVVRLRDIDPSLRPVLVNAYGNVERGPMTVRDNGYVRIIVEDLEPRERREQPPAGWNCPTY